MVGLVLVLRRLVLGNILNGAGRLMGVCILLLLLKRFAIVYFRYIITTFFLLVGSSGRLLFRFVLFALFLLLLGRSLVALVDFYVELDRFLADFDERLAGGFGSGVSIVSDIGRCS